MVRIPTNGPPTHPGELLLEEFLKPLWLNLQLAWDLHQAAHSPGADTIARIQRLPALAS